MKTAVARPTASVIIPTYNEKDNIFLLIERITNTLKNISFEIIVVDDNSPDGTWEIVENISKKNGAVRLIRRIEGRGLSTAVIAGMEAASGECFAVIDADLQHDETILPQMIDTVINRNYDVAIGSRGAEGGSYGEWSKARRFVSWVAASMAMIVLPVRIEDPMSGFFVISRDLFKRSVSSLNPRGFKILLEFIGRTKNIKIKEVGYTFRNRIHGETKLSGSVIRNYIIALYDMKFGKYLSSTFLMYIFVGGTGVAVNLAGFAFGEFIGLPRYTTGISALFDPLYLSVPFGIQISIISNYFLNNYITFFESRHKGSKLLTGFLVFQLISLLGLVIQMGVFQLLHVNGLLEGVIAEGLRKYFNNGIGIITATVSNYYLNMNFTWSRNK
jgi:dolichol-phosphate mannosyltransferase